MDTVVPLQDLDALSDTVFSEPIVPQQDSSPVVLRPDSTPKPPVAAPLREIRLDRSVLKGQLIEAKGGAASGSAASLMATRRSASGVMEGVSAEQMSKSTDADAGAVAKRVTGTSLVGGKYIYVRGLGERYTNMTLNGLPVPSPEKDKRVVPQDLFPASALEKFVIYKTFSPELYGDFAGGSVALETKGIPEKRFFKVSAGAGGTDYFHDDAFLNFSDNRLTYDGGNTYFGFDDGTRSLPSGTPRVILNSAADSVVPGERARGIPVYTAAERAAFSASFRNTYALDTARIRPNQNLSISLGDVRSFGDDHKAGYILSAGFKNKYLQRDRNVDLIGTSTIMKRTVRYIPFLQRYDTVYDALVDSVPYWAYDSVNARDTLLNRAVPVVRIGSGVSRRVQSGTYDATITGLADFGWDLGSDHHLYWHNFYVNIGSDEAATTLSRDIGAVEPAQDRPVEERYLLEFNRRSLFSTQAGGGHYLGLGPADSASWVLGYSRTRTETPDSRKYLYSRENDTAANYEYRNNDVWGTRIYEDLDEQALAGRADGFLSIPPAWSARDTFMVGGRLLSNLRLPQARAGFSGNYRNRGFQVTRYTYDSDDGLYTNQPLEQIREPEGLRTRIEQGVPGFDFTTTNKEYDEYRAGEGTYAGYVSLASGASLFSLPVDVDGGVRAERYSLDFKAPYTGQSLKEDKRVTKNEWTFLPSVGLTLTPYRNGKLHAHYAQTITRPEIREIAPFCYTDYLSSRFVCGDPSLEKTEVSHWDLRWDWYFPRQQILSVSLFDKRFNNPIEAVADVERNAGFINARSLGGRTAYVQGVEFEASIALESFGGRDAPKPLKGWTLYGNLALMRSRVNLDTAGDTSSSIRIGDLTSKSRSLVGQSPYLVNAKLSHETEWGRGGVLNAVLFNVAGPRIKEAGVGGAPDLVERPFPSLDYLGRITLFKRLEISWAVKNLLNSVKRVTGYEYNDSKTYYTLSTAQVDSIYAAYPRSYNSEVTREGVSYEMKLGYGF